MSSEPKVVRFTSLSQCVGQKMLLDIPELELRPTTLTLLSGRNGVGKTTLLKVVAGLLAPDHANVHIEGATFSWKQACRPIASPSGQNRCDIARLMTATRGPASVSCDATSRPWSCRTRIVRK